MIRRVLIVALALFAIANFARAFLAVQQAVQLPDLPVAAPPAYLVSMSMVWTVAFGACAYGMARSRGWAPRVTIAVIVLYQANLWLNHLVFSRSSEAEARFGFAALLSTLSILFISGAAWWVERQLKQKLKQKRQDRADIASGGATQHSKFTT